MAAKVAKGAVAGCFALSATLLALEGTGVVHLAGASNSLRGQRRLQQQQSTYGYGGTGMTQAQGYGGNGLTQVQGGMDGMSTRMQSGAERMQNGLEQAQGGVQNNMPDDGTFGSPYMNPNHYQNPNKHDPSNIKSFLPSSFHFALVVSQVIFAVIYYCTVVSNYPSWFGPSPTSCELQQQPAPCSLTNTSPTNCCLSWLCPQARASHTFDKTGTLEYWCGVVAMFFCPFCTLCWANACTDLNPKLGGQPANVLASMACTWCCSCCVIAQDAESLDAATGVRTEFCGVSGNPMPYGGGGGMGMGGPYGGGMGGPMVGPYGGGGGMAPGMMGMYPQY